MSIFRFLSLKSKRSSGTTGFSLIELSVALMIVGLMMGSALEVYRTYSKPRDIRTTRAYFYDIEAGMKQFLTRNGRLPCPAVMTDTPSSSTSGIEVSTCQTDAIEGGAGACTATGYCRSLGYDANGAGGADIVLSGAVPYVTLGIPMKTSIDGWERKIKYVVTARLTKPGTYDAAKGAITINHSNGSTNYASANSAQFTLISAGEDGRGAYTINGVLVSACTGLGRDIENCNEPTNATYYNKNDRSYVAGADHYDDLVHTSFKITASADRWVYGGSTLVDIMNKGGGRVGIGTPTPESPVHVNGNVKSASSVAADNYCNANAPGGSGTNCIKPELFSDAGIGTTCPSGTMKAIKSGQAECILALQPASITTGTCPTGKVMCGVSVSGGILCRVPGAAACP